MLEPTARLEEAESLVNPVHRMTDTEVYSESRPSSRGRTVGPKGQSGGGSLVPQGTDDHRNNHDAEFERRFAHVVCEKVVSFVAQRHLKRVVLVAERHMLGIMRKELPQKPAFEIHELAKDLSKLSPTDLHDHLVGEQLLPPRKGRADGGVSTSSHAV